MPSSSGGTQPEHGQTGQVVRSGGQVPVLPDAVKSADTGSASAVASTDHVRQPAFDLGPIRAIVGLPGRVFLLLTGGGQQPFMRPTLIVRPLTEFVQQARSGQSSQT